MYWARNVTLYNLKLIEIVIYFEIEDEDGIKRYGKSKEHRPNPIIQMNKPLLNHLKKKF